MSAAVEWLRRSRWAARSKQFGKLAARIDPRGKRIVTMEFDLPVGDAAPLWEHWINVVHHAAVIPALERGILRYTAFDWMRRGARLEVRDAEVKLATRGLELVSVMEHVIAAVGISDARWFTNPIVKLDLEGGLRVAFARPLARLELIQERAVIIAVGRGLSQLVGGAPQSSSVGKIINRCLDSNLLDRFATLGGVAKALRRAGGLRPRMHAQPDLWDAMELSLGFWALRDRARALECLDPWVSLSGTPLVMDLRDVIAKAPEEVEQDLPYVSDHPPWPLSRHSEPVVPEVPTILVPVPRVFENAHEVLNPPRVQHRTIEPAAPVRTSEQQAEYLLRRRLYREALDRVDAWLTTEPDTPRAHYLRGKTLLAMGRLPDARASFDRACTLRPQLLEAMLLRREVDRVMAATQAAAGIANPMTLALPDHLADLRDVLVSGRIVDAIQLLRRPTYDDDTVAQLLLAELLCTDDRHDDALAIYDRVATDEAWLGKARALLSLARPADALDALASTLADEAYELRSRALAALGRDEEAGVQMSTYLRLIEQRSDRRIESR